MKKGRGRPKIALVNVKKDVSIKKRKYDFW